jgi:transcriptional regulator with XRE-family HTH domain
MQDEKFIRERITKLRLNKNVSEYRMSLDLGHSDSYIRNITSGKALPSMSEFLYICEYFNITPKEFFDQESKNPELINELVSISNGLSNDDLLVLISMAKRMK